MTGKRVRATVAVPIFIALILGAVFIVTFLVASRAGSDVAHHSAEDLGHATHSIATGATFDLLYNLDVHGLGDELATLVSEENITYVAVRDASGKIVASQSDGPVPELQVASELSGQSLAQGELKEYHFEHYELIAGPLAVGSEQIGTLEIVFDLQHGQALIGSMQRTLVVYLLPFLAVIALVSLLLTRLATRPLGALSAAAERIGAGELDADVPVSGMSETATLGRALERMRVELQGLYSDMEQRIADRTQVLFRTNEKLEAENVERGRAEEALRRVSRENELVLNAAGEGIYGLDLEGRVTFVNPAAADMIQWQVEDLFGLSQHEVLHHSRADGTPYPREECPIYASFKEGQVHSTSHEVFWRKDRTSFPVEYTSKPIRDEQDEIIGAVVTFKDISERKQMEQELRQQALHDSLTGVLNHAAILDELKGAITAADNNTPCAVAMVDIDGMKTTNDTYGHPMGDAVIIEVARVLSRRGAFVGRYGGDEFLVVLPSAGRDEAEQYRDEVVAVLADARLTESETGASVPVAASIGLAIYPEDAVTIDDIVELSDSAMYASRRQRPVGTGELSPSRTLGGERAAAMVGQIVPILTANGTIEEKLRLVAHRLSVGAGYDAVNVDVFAKASGLPTARSAFSGAPDEVTDAWQAAQRRMEDEPILQQVKSTRRALIVEDPQHDERLTEGQLAVLRAAELQSAVVVPLFWGDDMMGVLSVASKRKDAFHVGDIEFLTAIATQIASVVRMATLFDELQSTSEHLSQTQEDAVLLLAAAAEAHDSTTGHHLRSVRVLTEALARELSYDEESAQELGMAAVLHDIGKIRVLESILASTGSLDGEEWESMQKHSVWGADFLAGHPGYELAATVARSHHERWEGGGYPDGLVGDSIPIAATIVAVADAFDAITSDRPYRASQSVDYALREIQAGSGTQFNPSVVEALVQLDRRGELPVSAIEATGQQAA